MARFKTDTHRDWARENPILEKGEPGYEEESKKFKIGDGVSRWTELPYAGSSQVTRSQIENTLYDKVYSWELQPGSDVMATCVGVLPKIGVYNNQDVYMGLVTLAADEFGENAGQPWSGDNGWVLQPPNTPLTIDGFTGPNAEGIGVHVVPGVYIAGYYTPVGEQPPYAFPEGWTPGNTTGEGPVLPFVGQAYGVDIYAGLAMLDAPFILDTVWSNAFSKDTVTLDQMVARLIEPGITDRTDGYYLIGDTVPPGLHVIAYEVPTGSPAPTTLPEGWTFRPYGIGPVAITDENAGGLIGDVAYVVGGYVYNDSDPIVIEGGGDNATWPFIERYDLAAKKWLSRIPMPIVEFVPGHYATLQTGYSAADTQTPTGIIIVVGEDVTPALPLLNGHPTALYWSTNVPQDVGEWPVSGGGWVLATSAGPVTQGGVNGGIDPYPISCRLETTPNNGATAEQIQAWWDVVIPTLREGSTPPEHDFPDVGGVPYNSEGGIAGVIDGKLYFGGGDGDNISGYEFFVYDPVDNSINQLADIIAEFEGNGDQADYHPYGVVEGKLVWFSSVETQVAVYDPANNTWSAIPYDGPNIGTDVNDQAQGFEIDDKLWFIYNGTAQVFDLETLTSETKADSGRSSGGQPYLIKEKIHEFDIGLNGTSIYDPTTDTWTPRTDLTNDPASGYDSEFFGVTYNDTPYLLSAVEPGNTPNTVGIYGLTGVALDKPQSQRLDEAADAAALAVLATAERKHDPFYVFISNYLTTFANIALPVDINGDLQPYEIHGLAYVPADTNLIVGAFKNTWAGTIHAEFTDAVSGTSIGSFTAAPGGGSGTAITVNEGLVVFVITATGTVTA